MIYQRKESMAAARGKKKWRVLMHCCFFFFVCFFPFLFFLPLLPSFPKEQKPYFLSFDVLLIFQITPQRQISFWVLADLLLHQRWRLGFVLDRSSRVLVIMFCYTYISPLYKHQVFECCCLLTPLEESTPGWILYPDNSSAPSYYFW